MDSRELDRLERKFTKEVLWLYVLALLRKKPSHAYTLRKLIERKFGFLPGNVTPYVVLYKLQGRGFVKTRQKGNRIVYSITPAGRKLLVEARKRLQDKFKLIFG